jgi:hypothetical protein
MLLITRRGDGRVIIVAVAGFTINKSTFLEIIIKGFPMKKSGSDVSDVFIYPSVMRRRRYRLRSGWRKWSSA